MSFQNFEVVSGLSGERYQVEYCWLQTAISLRHSDTVDVQFLVNGKATVLGLPHAALEEACRKAGAPLRDELCVRIAAAHLEEALRTGSAAESALWTLEPSCVLELAEKQLSGRPGS